MNDVVYQSLYEYLDTDQLIANLQEHVSQAKSQQIDRTEIIYEYYAFLTALSDHLSPSNIVHAKLEKWSKATQFEEKNYICRMEILDQNKKLKIMYFPKPDIVEKYWDNPYVQESKKLMLQDIKRDNPDVKINQFDVWATKF